jgi:orotate phosphoribosyltransferase
MSLLNLNTYTNLRALNQSLNDSLIIKRRLSGEEVRHVLGLCGALFMHPGPSHPDIPHPRLRSGRCSNAFCNAGVALAYNGVRKLFGQQLVMLLQEKFTITDPLDWVVSSDHSGAPIVYAAADTLHLFHPNLRVDFCVKDERDPADKKQVWDRHVIPADAVVAHFEELATTGGAAQAVRDGIRKAHPYPINFLPWVPTIVKRKTDQVLFTEAEFISLTDLPGAEEYGQNCPLCAVGSSNEKFKTHWDSIIAQALAAT